MDRFHDSVRATPLGSPGLSPETLLSSINLASPHKSHRFTSALNQAVLTVLQKEYFMFLSEMSPSVTSPKQQRWNLEWEKDGITMHTLPVSGSQLAIVRGHGVIRGYSINEIFSVIRNSTCRKKWDARYESGTPLAVLNSDDVFSHTVQKGSFPVSQRDFVVALTVRRPTRRELVYVTTSVKADTGDVPGVVVPADGESGRVRAQLDFAGWLLKETRYGVEVSYLVQADPKGSIPSSIVKMVQNNTPLAISSVSTFLEQEGPIPFVVQVPDMPSLNPSTQTLTFTSESWNSTTNTYDLSMDAISPSPAVVSTNRERGVYIPLAIPQHRFYQSGCNVKVQLSSRGGNKVNGLVVKSGLLVGHGVPGDLEVERRDGGLLKGVISSATTAVLLIWIEGWETEGFKFGVRIHLEKGSWEGKVFVNDEVAGPILDI
ncbi:hypothetical protein BDR26DRAFT_861095 [Obelidium mucronatum]|nr:hypothetical protein BDR26DRAFT_861095 [Obelidium mucronatum]